MLSQLPSPVLVLLWSSCATGEGLEEGSPLWKPFAPPCQRAGAAWQVLLGLCADGERLLGKSGIAKCTLG